MDPQILMQINEIYRNEVYNEETLSEDELVDINGWVSQLISEGYDLDDYSDEELYAAYLEDLDEAKADEGLTSLQKIRKRNKEGNLVMPVGDQTSERRSYHKAGRGEKKERGDKYDVESTVGKDTWAREAEIKKRYGSHYDETGRRERIVKAIKSRKKVGGPKGLPEELDLYDIVSEYLVSEGFCDSYEDADVIMANISEQWIDGILNEVTGGGQVRFRKGLPGDKPKKRGMKKTPQEKAAEKLGGLDVDPTADPQRRARLAKVALR